MPDINVSSASSSLGLALTAVQYRPLAKISMPQGTTADHKNSLRAVRVRTRGGLRSLQLRNRAIH